MLYWQRKPDPLLTTIVHDALATCLDYADVFAHPGRLPPGGEVGTTIQEIDFEGILEVFFWDLDFTIPFDELSALGLEGRESMGFTDETMGIAAGLAPHPEELSLAKESEPTWDEEDPDEECPPFRRGFGTYPALEE